MKANFATKIRKLIKFFSGRYSHIKVANNSNKEWFGNDYGGFYLCPDHLNSNSIVCSFGIGQDISFDSGVIEKFDCNIFAFDPTPKSISWLKNNELLPKKFKYFQYGLGLKSEIVEFYLPKNPSHVSGSFIKQSNVDDNQVEFLEMKSWNDIVEDLDFDKIDVLKLDIEGSEYEVIESILSSGIYIKQILIEFHDRMFDTKFPKSIGSIEILNNYGYEIFGVSDSFEEISFIKA